MALKRSSDIQGGSSFFKPKDFEGAVALLIEPLSVQRDVTFTPYQAKPGVTDQRDEVTADVTVFASAADLKAGKGVEQKGMTVTHKAITSRLSRVVGDQVVGVMGKKQFEGSAAPAWVIDEVDDSTFEAVASYYEKREEAVKAALADVPDFD